MRRLALPFILLASRTAANAQALPYPKNGQCAGSYTQSGAFCIPQSERSAPAIPKPRDGRCPTGYLSGAHSCTKMERR